MRHAGWMKILAPVCIAASSLLFLHGVGSAQEVGGVAESGMSQGQAQIATRANVTMSLSTAEGTTNARLQAVTPQISEKLSVVRRCYSTVTERRPTVTGALDVRFVAPPTGARVNVDIEGDHVNDAELVRCVTRAFQGIRVSAANRPVGLVVHLTFNNTAAAGVEATAVHRAQQSAVEIVGSGAEATVRGQLPTGELSFTAQGPTDPAELRALGTVVLDHIAGLLDCRRRAGRRGASPAGEIRMTFSVRGSRLVDPTIVASSVSDRNAGMCAARALGALNTSIALHTPTASLVVQFAGAGSAP